MKRIAILLVLIVLALSFSLSLSPMTAVAEEEDSYLLITKDNVTLYTNTFVSEALFTLPRTYYVKLKESNWGNKGYHLVEYNGVEGLVKADEVASTPITNVSDPYYVATTISAHAGQYLYSKPSFSSQTDQKASEIHTLVFLGKASGEKGSYGTSTWFAVLYANKVYYIHSAMTENLDLLEKDLPPHPNSVTSESVENTTAVGESAEATTPKDSVDIVRILLIIGMIVPIVIILFVLFRPRKKTRSRSSRDDDDED